jgi:hypothetical protein
MVPITAGRAGWMALALLMTGTPLLAVTRWKAIEPGASTRDQVDNALGQPQRNISGMLYEYAPQQGTGRVLVEYRPTGVVHRVQVELVKPVSRGALVKQFQLEEFTPLKKAEPDGTMAEYFGSNASLVFFYVGTDESSGVARIGFYSGELFDQVTGPLMSSLPAPPSTATTPVTDATLIIETLNPAACQDIYVWADMEQPKARRSRNAGRRQLLLDILIASQKGDCARARTQAAAYKSAYPK